MGLDQKTLDELHEIAGRYPEARSGLLPMLHLVQSTEGRVTGEGIEACAEILGISAAEVSGVATFYTMYKRRPVGDYAGENPAGGVLPGGVSEPGHRRRGGLSVPRPRLAA